MTEKSSYSEIIAQISPKGEKWEKLNFEGKQKIDILNFLRVFPYIRFCMPKQKNLKKLRSQWSFWPGRKLGRNDCRPLK